MWIKDAASLGRSDYQTKHEGVLYGFVPGATRRGRGKAGWFGGNDQTTVLEAPRPNSSPDHPTPKPVELVSRLIANSSRSGQIVLDPFAGSGSTLMAAEALDRIAYLVELDPTYCDVILARFQHRFGIKPTKERT